MRTFKSHNHARRRAVPQVWRSRSLCLHRGSHIGSRAATFRTRGDGAQRKRFWLPARHLLQLRLHLGGCVEHQDARRLQAHPSAVCRVRCNKKARVVCHRPRIARIRHARHVRPRCVARCATGRRARCLRALDVVHICTRSGRPRFAPRFQALSEGHVCVQASPAVSLSEV